MDKKTKRKTVLGTIMLLVIGSILLAVVAWHLVTQFPAYTTIIVISIIAFMMGVGIVMACAFYKSLWEMHDQLVEDEKSLKEILTYVEKIEKLQGEQDRIIQGDEKDGRST